MATKLSGYAKTAVVENRTGAGGQIAINFVKGKPADGSFMLQTPTSMLTMITVTTMTTMTTRKKKAASTTCASTWCRIGLN